MTVFEVTALLRLALFAIVLVVGVHHRDTLVIVTASLAAIANLATSLSQLTLTGLIGTPVSALLCMVLYDHATRHTH